MAVVVPIVARQQLIGCWITMKTKGTFSTCYVYLLFDKQTNEIFYVGKGKGSRFGHHLIQAKKCNNSNVENEKIKKIKSIGDGNLGCTILRRNLTEDEAFHVEAATIDLLKSSNYKNVVGNILNIQSGHGKILNGSIDVKLFNSMRTKYVELMKSETLLCLNISHEEYIKATSIPQLVHKKKWKIVPDEANKAAYTIIECNNVVVAVFNSGCWSLNADGKTCSFNSNQQSSQSILDRFVSHKLPKRNQGTPQARYINYTDVKLAKQGNVKIH